MFILILLTVPQLSPKTRKYSQINKPPPISNIIQEFFSYRFDRSYEGSEEYYKQQLKSDELDLEIFHTSMLMASSSSHSPCAACKFLRRKCLPECVFAPYFPPDQQQKFTSVHKVFGASNVTKLLNELHPQQREDAVNSLAYEADMRLRDPVYGCVGVISVLQHQLRQLQIDLTFAKSELSKYQDPLNSAFIHHHHHHQPISLLGGGLTAAKDFQHPFFPPQQPGTSTGYDASSSYLAVNMSAGVGQLSGFQQARAAGTEADGRRTPAEPS